MIRAAHAFAPLATSDRCGRCPIGDAVPEAHIRHAPELAPQYLRDLADRIDRIASEVDEAVRFAHLLGADIQAVEAVRDGWADLRAALLRQ